MDRRNVLVESAVVLVVIAAALGIRAAVEPWLQSMYPFVTVFPAITLLAWWKGMRTGVSALVLGWLGATYFFVAPGGWPLPVTGQTWLAAGIFLLSASLIVALGEMKCRALRKSRQGARDTYLLGSIVQSSNDAIVSKTLDGIITSWNHGAEQIFGWKAHEAIGKSITLIIPPNRLEEEQMIIGRIRQGEGTEHFETVRVAKDGRKVELSITVSPVRDAEGKVIGASKIARDISEARRIQKERDDLLVSERVARSEAERLSRVKDDFVATLSHELRTPLNAMLGWSQLLRRPGVQEKDLHEGLTVIERNARLQSQMIEDLLDMSRIVSGKVRLDVQRVNMLSVVENAIASVKPAADAKQIRLQPVLDPRTNVVNGDPTRLQQIVWNLLSNAVKFTPKDGRVQVVLRRVASSIEVEVSDTGKGIKPEFLHVIFDRFRQEDTSTTRQFGGLGLGLAIVKHLVELHGGSVRAASDGEGKGSSFTISLPLAVLHSVPHLFGDVNGQVSADATRSSVTVLAELAGINVLVVDDEADSRELIARILRDCKAKVETADSVDAGLRSFEQVRPDVVLSDIGMPERDGYDLIRTIRALPADKGRGTPAAALTALARSEDRTKALLEGFQVHLAKPVEPAELVAVVSSLARMRFERRSTSRN